MDEYGTYLKPINDFLVVCVKHSFHFTKVKLGINLQILMCFKHGFYHLVYCLNFKFPFLLCTIFLLLAGL